MYILKLDPYDNLLWILVRRPYWDERLDIVIKLVTVYNICRLEGIVCPKRINYLHMHCKVTIPSILPSRVALIKPKSVMLIRYDVMFTIIVLVLKNSLADFSISPWVLVLD
jgi:hypothetical protein